MPAPREAPSSADVAVDVTNLSTGLGIVTVALFPFALPGLLLALPLVLLVAPLALGAVGVLLLIGILVLPFRLARIAFRRRSHRRSAAGRPGSAPPAAAGAQS